jgi:pyruvate/2-oxoglutarate dehydrogenase complex dihydrolipoamide dehydrogenase (E3) component
MTVQHYDSIIIGAGQAGVPLAGALHAAGRKTAIIEQAFAGGTCINYGCTPTKTMVASARMAHLARRVGDFGLKTGPLQVDMARVRQRKRDMVESFRGGTERRLQRGGADVIYGQAAFTGPGTLEVCLADGASLKLTAENIFINTGGRPAVPNLPGLDRVRFCDSTSIMELDAVPEHLLILGGGYIGLEFGQIFRRFGSRVTIIQRGPQLAGREDPDIARTVTDILREDGVEVLLDATAVEVGHGPSRNIVMRVKMPGGECTLEGSHLLAAVGRTPNTGDLNLAAAGVATNAAGYVVVNERLESSVPGVYALGDVNGGPALTHVSYDDFRIIRTNLIEGGQASTTGRLIPYVIYIDPQLGRVGLSETEARERGLNIRVANMPMDYIARTSEIGETRGLMKAVVDADSGQILGAAVLGTEGGEIMAMLQIAMMGRLPYSQLKEAVFAHPSLAEGLNTLFMQLD